MQLPHEFTGPVTARLEPASQPDAYWQASLFVREFYELVPFWHDSNWHEEEVLLAAPTGAAEPGPDYVAPSHWPPAVDVSETSATVRFHTFCFGSVREHTDRWTRDLTPDGWQPYACFGNARWILGSGLRPPH